jgi:hypothetical protein
MKKLFIILAVLFSDTGLHSNPCLDVTLRNLPGLINPDSTMEDTCVDIRKGKRFYVKTILIIFDYLYLPTYSKTITDNQYFSLSDFDSTNYPMTYNSIKKLINLPVYVPGSLRSMGKVDSTLNRARFWLTLNFSNYIDVDTIITILDTNSNSVYEVINIIPNGRINHTSIEEQYDVAFKQTQNEIIIENYEVISFELFDIKGCKLNNSEIKGNSININNLPQGIYFLVLYYNDKQTTIKFIK